MLDSTMCWAPEPPAVIGRYMQIDLGNSYRLAGAVVQGRADAFKNQYVKSYQFKYSVDGSSFTSFPSDLTGCVVEDPLQRCISYFTVKIDARYVRFYPQTWKDYMSMRAGVLVINASQSLCSIFPPNGYYYDLISGYLQLCDTSCATCTDTAKKCIACAADSYFIQDIANRCEKPISGSYYDATASKGYYFDAASSTLKTCYVSCKSCTGTGIASNHNCSTCITGYYPLSNNLKMCYTEVDSYYLNIAISQFYPCYSSCKSCFGDGSDANHNCSTCKTGYMPTASNTKMCYQGEMDFYYTDYLISQYVQCYSSCKSCLGAGTATNHNCSTCKTGYMPLYPDNKNCYTGEQNDFIYFVAEKSQYFPCYSSCKRCLSTGSDSDHKCTTCKTDYYPIVNKSSCYTGQLESYYFDFKTNEFNPCYNSCKFCIVSGDKINNNCSICKDGFYYLASNPKICMQGNID